MTKGKQGAIKAAATIMAKMRQEGARNPKSFADDGQRAADARDKADRSKQTLTRQIGQSKSSATSEAQYRSRGRHGRQQSHKRRSTQRARTEAAKPNMPGPNISQNGLAEQALREANGSLRQQRCEKWKRKAAVKRRRERQRGSGSWGLGLPATALNSQPRGPEYRSRHQLGGSAPMPPRKKERESNTKEEIRQLSALKSRNVDTTSRPVLAYVLSTTI